VACLLLVVRNSCIVYRRSRINVFLEAFVLSVILRDQHPAVSAPVPPDRSVALEPLKIVAAEVGPIMFKATLVVAVLVVVARHRASAAGVVIRRRLQLRCLPLSGLARRRSG
jgi:hypothetical protein